MPYSITCSTKILTLAMAPFLFILVCILYEFAMVPGVYILVSPQEEEALFLGHRCTNSAVHSSRRFKPLSAIIFMEKTQTRNSTLFMVLIIWPSSTLKFVFVFYFNECLWAIFSSLSFENFWSYIWVVVVWLLIFNDTDEFTSPLNPCPWIKNLSAKCWE